MAVGVALIPDIHCVYCFSIYVHGIFQLTPPSKFPLAEYEIGSFPLCHGAFFIAF